MVSAWVYVVAVLASFGIAMVASPAGILGAVLLLPFQVTVLGTLSPVPLAAWVSPHLRGSRWGHAADCPRAGFLGPRIQWFRMRNSGRSWQALLEPWAYPPAYSSTVQRFVRGRKRRTRNVEQPSAGANAVLGPGSVPGPGIAPIRR
jgi:hypothetical protein